MYPYIYLMDLPNCCQVDPHFEFLKVIGYMKKEVIVIFKLWGANLRVVCNWAILIHPLLTILPNTRITILFKSIKNLSNVDETSARNKNSGA